MSKRQGFFKSQPIGIKKMWKPDMIELKFNKMKQNLKFINYFYHYEIQIIPTYFIVNVFLSEEKFLQYS